MPMGPLESRNGIMKSEKVNRLAITILSHHITLSRGGCVKHTQHEIETENVYEDFWSDKDKFDNIEYPENSPYFNKSNNKSDWKVQR